MIVGYGFNALGILSYDASVETDEWVEVDKSDGVEVLWVGWSSLICKFNSCIN